MVGARSWLILCVRILPLAIAASLWGTFFGVLARR